MQNFKNKLKQINLTQKNKLFILGAIIVVILLVTLGSYFIGVNYYQTHTVPNTYFLNNKVGSVTNDELVEKANTYLNETKIMLVDSEDEQKELTYTELGISVDEKLENYVEETKDPYMWPFNMFEEKNIVIDDYIVADSEKEKSALDDSGIFDENERTKTKDAYVDYNGDEYVVVKEVKGNTVNEEKVLEELNSIIEKGGEEVELAQFYTEPKVVSSDLNDTVEELNQKLASEVTVDFGKETHTFSQTEKKEWITYTSDGKINVDSSIIASQLATYAENNSSIENTEKKRVVTTYDTSGLETEISEDLINGAYNNTYKAKEKTSEQDLEQKAEPKKDTYIEVNISSQHLWYYEDGELVIDTPVVTGDKAEGWSTPTGNYGVWNKEKNRVLNGATVGFDYEVEVEFWMPIDNTGVGIHDAPWIPLADFGSDRYLENGSHGCINVPPGTIDELYAKTEIGTPVYVTP